MKQCKYCKDLDEMCWECIDDPHHGENAYCEECMAEYYREYNRDIVAVNDKAEINHPELKR